MTIIRVDEWHTIEVGVPLVFSDCIHQQVALVHDVTCPAYSRTSANWDGSVTREIEFRCTTALDSEGLGIDYWVTEVLGLEYGLWRVKASLNRDYSGEFDVNYEIERLEGPIDERSFEEPPPTEHNLPPL